MRYLNLDVKLTVGEDGTTAEASWAHGQDTCTIEVEPSDLDVSVLATEHVAVETLEAFGARLFACLFESEQGRLGEQLNRCFGATLPDRSLGLRLRLRLGEGWVGGIPWEFLFWPSRDAFVGTSPETALVRYLEVPDTVRELEIEGPLNVLIVAPASEGLAVETEVRNVQALLDEMVEQVRYRVLPTPVTRDGVRDALREDTYQVLHFIGHGGIRDDVPLLALDAADGGTDLLDHRQLARLLEHPTLSLVVLNSCLGAVISPDGPFVGMAQQLVRRGIPAVVAMQFEIHDRVALRFAREFYRTLLLGRDRGNVEIAMATARNALATDFPDTVALGTPVLFMHTEDGVLFDIRTGRLLDDVAGSPERAHTLRSVAESRRKNLALMEDEAPGDPRRARREEAALKAVERRLAAGLVLASIPLLVGGLVAAAAGLFLLDRVARWVGAETLTAALAYQLEGAGLLPGDGFHPELAIVAIDSIDEVAAGAAFGPSWRPRVAHLVDRLSLAGAGAVALAIDFERPSPDDTALARAFTAARERGTPVVVAVSDIEAGAPLLAPALRGVVEWGIGCRGFGSLQVVPLAVAREGDLDRPPLPSLALAAVAAWRGDRVERIDPGETRLVMRDSEGRPVTIGFARLGRPSTDPGCSAIGADDLMAETLIDYSPASTLRDPLRRLAYRDVVGGDEATLAGSVAGRLVLVGSTRDPDFSLHLRFGGSRDSFEFHADAIDTLLRGIEILPLGRAPAILLVLVMALVGAALANRPSGVRPRMRLALLAVAGAGLILLSVYAFHRHRTVIEPFYAGVALVLSYAATRRAREWYTW